MIYLYIFLFLSPLSYDLTTPTPLPPREFAFDASFSFLIVISTRIAIYLTPYCCPSPRHCVAPVPFLDESVLCNNILFRDNNKSNSEAANGKYQIIMSDSDDDGFFEAMAKVGTRTSKRKENKTTEERLAMLESAIAMEDKNRQLQGRLLKMKQEEPSDDRVKQAEEQLILAATTTAQRRQETYNTIHGIHDLDDGLTDCKRMALSNAVDTDKSSLLGTRKTLQCCVEPKELYRTNQEAVKALVAILKSKELKNHVIGKKMLALSSNVHNLSIFLSKPHALMVAMNQHRTPHLPHHLCQWLFFMACSRNCNVMQLSRAAFKCLEHIWKNTMEPAEDPFLVLNDLESQLRSWFGLKITVWDVHNKYQGETDGDEIIKSTTWSLRRWLTLWGILFQNGLVTGTETLKETATRCVVALVQAGLDPVVVHNPGQG